MPYVLAATSYSQHTAPVRADGSRQDQEISDKADEAADIPSAPPSTNADLQPPSGVNWKNAKGTRKVLLKKSKENDYYALLGLKQERWMASEQELKTGELYDALVFLDWFAGLSVCDTRASAFCVKVIM
jgi:hypothetical protein